MNVIEAFGGRVSSLAPEHPDRARSLLTLGFRANGWKNRLSHKSVSKSDQMLFQHVNRAMVACLAHPDRNVMVSLFTPCEPLLIRGLHPYSCEGFSSYLSGAMAEQGFLRCAEDTGIATTLCSYHKAFIGAAQTGVMPKPKFILSTTLACDANLLTFRHMAEFYDVPHFSLDVPFHPNEDAVIYVADQLRAMEDFIAEQTGIPTEETRLRAAVARSMRTMENFHQGLSLRRGKQILSDMTSELLRTAALHFLLGSEETEAYTAQLLREIETAPPATGKQLLWVHTTPYWVQPLRELLGRTPRVQIAACDMSYEGIGAIDPSKPYEAMARRLVYSPFNGPVSRRIDRALEVARQVGADGAIWFCHWGCKHTLGGARLAKKAFEEQGLPTLLLDGDSCDRGFGGEGQALTRFEAFLEMLEETT